MTVRFNEQTFQSFKRNIHASKTARQLDSILSSLHHIESELDKAPSYELAQVKYLTGLVYYIAGTKRISGLQGRPLDHLTKSTEWFGGAQRIIADLRNDPEMDHFKDDRLNGLEHDITTRAMDAARILVKNGTPLQLDMTIVSSSEPPRRI